MQQQPPQQKADPLSPFTKIQQQYDRDQYDAAVEAVGEIP